MKKIYNLFVISFLFSIQVNAQAPNQFNYQGVARNASGLVLPNQAVGLRFTIHQGSAGGTVVYQETQSATTNLLGLFTVAIGNGTTVSGTFANIGWATNTEFLQVEMDPAGGTSYLNMGTNQFLSVPYALSSGSGWNLTGNSSTNGTDYIGTTDANDVIIKAHNNEVMRIANANNNVGIGTNNPNAGALVDMTSSTQGLLIPRMATAPASPSLGMQYFNTATGCFMFYNGSSWQAMVCGCPNPPATPGTISSSIGSGTFCSGATGVVYSVAPLNNVISYTWSTPAGATITGGQGSNAITVTEGTTSSTISVTATNNCSTGAASSLTLTVGVATSITSQPSNSAGSSGGSAGFTVGATGSSLTYQWQVNPGSGFTNVFGATNATLTLTGLTSGMDGYTYKAIVTGLCGSVTSNAATLSVCSSGPPSVPIVITNSQSTATSSGLQVKLSINFASYTANGLNANLNNVEFSTGPGGSGTPLYAWIESPTAPTASSTEITTTPTSSNATAAVVWVNLGSSTVPASGTLTIYMSFQASAVMTGTTGFTGEAPQLTSTYGQFDNGALVFPNFYDNFAGTSLASKWTNTGEQAITVNNKLTITFLTMAQNWWAIYTNTFTGAVNTVAETYCINTGSSSGGIGIATGISAANPGLSSELVSTPNFGTGGSVVSSPTANQNSGGSALFNTYYVFTATFTNTIAPIMQLNYTTVVTGNASTLVTPANSPLGLAASKSGGSFQWFRDRVLPPNGVLPTGAAGTYGCY